MQSIAMKTAVFFVILGLALIQSAHSAVFSVDLGSEWMKVAVVDVKPGQSPISIALNEMSKRKSPSVVAFSGGNRLLAEEAIGIAARYPERVYSRIRDMVGKPLDSVQEIARRSGLPYEFVEESGSWSIRVDNQETYRSEELLGMILGYCQNLAEANTKSIVKDAVITVPPYFGHSERRAVLAAAQAAGINVLSLMNEHAAAALQYGIDKDFSSESRLVLFYDMGSSNTFAAVVRFFSYTVKEFGKNVSHNAFELQGIRWDAELGGQTIEMRLVEHFAKEFEKQTGIDVRGFPKAMAKLKKQAKRTKEILSANTEAPFFVDSLHDDRDFKSHITRKAFEELCSDVWERAVVPLKKVLADLSVTPDQLYAVELLGGGTRVPKVQQVLISALGNKGLERHLDADEAITLGAALHAANVSDGIKLNRKIGMVDGATYGVVMKVDDDSYELVVPRLKRLGIKLARAVKRQEDYQVSLFYDPEGELPPGIREREIAAFKITGLTEAASKYATYNLSAPIKSVLHFGLSRSGVISLERAEAVVEVMEWVEVAPPKNNSTSNSTLEDLNASNSTEKEQAPEVEKKLRKRTIRIPLKIEVLRDPGAAAEKEVTHFRSRLLKLKLIDDEKRLTEESKNNLESYIYTTKEMLGSIEDLAKVSTAQQREDFMSKLNEAEDWLYSDGESVGAGEFQKRLEELKAVGDPMFFRLEQMMARPAAVEEARKSIAEAEASIEDWKQNKPWISDTEVKSEIDGFKEWLNTKEGEQKQRSNYDDPVFSSTEVYNRIEKLKLLVMKTGKQPKPKPKVEKATKAGNESDATKAENEADASQKESEASKEQDEVPKQEDAPQQEAEVESETETVRDEL